MHPRYIAGLVALGTLLLMAHMPAEAGFDRDVWYKATLDGIRIGYVHETVGQDPDGIVTTTLVSKMSVRRSGEPVSVGAEESWSETADGSPISHESTTTLAGEDISLVSRVDGSILRIRSVSMGEATHRELPFDEDFRFPHGIMLLHLARGFEPGDTYSYSTYVSDFDSIGRSTVTVDGVEELDLMGETVALNKLSITIEIMDGLKLYEWRDDTGLIWRQESPELGVVYERCTQQDALAEAQAAEILSNTMVPCGVLLAGPQYDVDSALYEIWIDDDDAAKYVPLDSRQTEEGSTDRGILLRVTRRVPEADAVERLPFDGPDFEPYLEQNPLMQFGNPLLFGASTKTIWGTDRDSWKAAKQIENWVFSEIEHKGLGVALGSALEVLKRLEGDCSEHAILMGAMTRAVRIPTKLVGGLIYFDGDFAYHMWNEVWTGDGWYALDPTQGLGSVDATHIKLAESSLPGGSFGELSVPIMRVFRRMNVRLIEYSIGDTTVRP